MDKATLFSFEAYSIGSDRKSLYFDYASFLENGSTLKFRETISLPAPVPDHFSPVLLDSLLSNLHLALGISYWKLHLAPVMEIRTKPLSHRQAIFWNTVYEKGLGEFFYRNNIDFRGLIHFPDDNNAKTASADINVQDRSLVGIGGGKDSLVAVELLKKNGKKATGLIIETNKRYPLIREVLPLTGIEYLAVGRTIDGQVAKLNASGRVYNGHIPISSIYAFLGIAVSAFSGYRYFIVSNEQSANSGNTQYLGSQINHQWSKSEEFEHMFREYVREFITPSVLYFSLLRPLWELKIVQLFTSYPRYFKHFSSCNRNFSTSLAPGSKWCGSCAKCAFAFASFSAFLKQDEMVEIFGKNMFEDASLAPLFRQLLAVEGIKPFDCVGTGEEVRLAFYLAGKENRYAGTPIMDMFSKEVLPHIKEPQALERKILALPDGASLPSDFKTIFTL